MGVYNESEYDQQSIGQSLGTKTFAATAAAPNSQMPTLAVRAHTSGVYHPARKVDVLLVNPPTPDGGIWIRSQHRVGRRSRENMIWPQVSLAQLAALLQPDYSVEIIDANALRMKWAEFEGILRDRRPRFYITQVTAPTLTNDMYGVFSGAQPGAITIAFGTHVTPMPRETMLQFPGAGLCPAGRAGAGLPRAAGHDSSLQR